LGAQATNMIGPAQLRRALTLSHVDSKSHASAGARAQISVPIPALPARPPVPAARIPPLPAETPPLPPLPPLRPAAPAVAAAPAVPASGVAPSSPQPAPTHNASTKKAFMCTVMMLVCTSKAQARPVQPGPPERTPDCRAHAFSVLSQRRPAAHLAASASVPLPSRRQRRRERAKARQDRADANRRPWLRWVCFALRDYSASSMISRARATRTAHRHRIST
jgi:hypothetical protein